jgi:hypothetical protein
MEGSRQSSTNLSVQLPTKIESFFHPCREEKFTSVPMFAMVQTILHFGHNPGSNRFVTWVPFPESLTMSNDPLSIMWWNPTHDDFKSFDGSLVDGLGELSRSKFLSFQAMVTSLENRIEDYKKTSKPNNLLSSLVKAMQDACLRLGSLKTTYSEMRFGVTEFQRYYLEARGCLDYLELYKPRMDGQKPPAETVANCVGRFHKHCACSSGLPHGRFTHLVPPTCKILGQSCPMQHFGNCCPPQPCRRLMCFATRPALPPNILWPCNQS